MIELLTRTISRSFQAVHRSIGTKRTGWRLTPIGLWNTVIYIMQNPIFDRRRHARHQAQQQPQQCEVVPANPAEGADKSARNSPRQVWQSLINRQAAKQSNRL